MNNKKINDLIEFNKRFLKFENLNITFEDTPTQLCMRADELTEFNERFFGKQYFSKTSDFEEIMDAYECMIINQIILRLSDVNDYYNGEIDFNIHDFIEMIFCIKESMPQLSKQIDYIIIEDLNNCFYENVENHNRLIKDLITYKNVMNIKNGLLAI